jgi:5-formyltetrahydrofolate cyclo-ligase
MTILEKKQRLRQSMRTLLSSVTNEAREQAACDLSDHLMPWLKGKNESPLKIALFSPLADEISINHLDTKLKDLNATRAVAVINSRDDLCFVPLDHHETLSCITWNDFARADEACLSQTALAPSYFDIIFLPGLAFDQRGQRLGRGKAHFDRALAPGKSDSKFPLLVGLALDEQVVDEVPNAPHDVAVHYLCTPYRGLLQII